jgi:diguanylate cyclase (GGDEF)-like protein/PAS domain S-box-containing protein
MAQSGYLVLALLLLAGLFGLTFWIYRRQRVVIEQLLASNTLAPAAPAAPAATQPAAESALLLPTNLPADTHAAPVSVLADRVHEAVLLHGPDGIVYANQQFSTLLGAPAADLVGVKLAEILPPEYSDLVADNIRRRLAGESVAERYEVDLLGLQGQNVRLELSSWPIVHAGKPVLLIIGVEVLPTQTFAILDALSGGQRRSRARLALESLNEAVITTDARGRVDYINAAASALLGISADSARGQELESISKSFDEANRKLFLEPARQALVSGAPLNLGRRALVLARQSGSDRHVELSAAPLRTETGDVTGSVLMLHDVTEARGLSRQMSYQATHDALTGLINRREFERRLQESVEERHLSAGSSVLCYLDLDRFKQVNDTAGHQAGDALLRDLAKLLRETVRDTDTVARLGGDEFGVLLPGCPLEKARQIADDLCRKVADNRFVWKDNVFEIGVSIGLVGIGPDAGSMEQLLTAADSACYAAKRQNEHVVIYSPEDATDARTAGDIQWLKRLQIALRDKHFELYRQPIVAAFSGEEQGPAMEVLMRLRGEDGATIEPAEFLGAAQHYRLMSLIDRRVIQTALTALGNGEIALPPKRSIAINVSSQTLADPQFLEFVVECLDSTGANPSQVCFEIAESAVMANMDITRRFIGVLHGMGCRFALDDFGSGLGSFNNLKSLAVDYLKIDGSIMRNIGSDPVNQELVGAMMRMARALNVKVIAEQLEDSAAIDAARRMGVDFLQGYAVARPEPMALAA